MTTPKKIYARFYDFHGRPAIEEAYPGDDGKDKDTDTEYLRADTVIDPDKELVEAMYSALNLLEVYGAENSKDYRAIKKVYDEFDKE